MENIMAQVVQHFQEHYRIYIVVLVCGLPPIIIFRRYSVPLLTYSIESAVYVAILHGVIGFVVFLARRFKLASSMDLNKVDPEWGTPMLRFWAFEQYNPRWIAGFELVLAAVIVFLVFRYRPMQTQKHKARKAPPKKKTGVGSGTMVGRR
ncbi:MAG TPA: hypothetical protein HPP83_02540 [Candidatus Hydrogenedentes bacterium]|nr:hypothetical protein [Candidatus Hydrogenedentota bacterium]